MGDTRPAQLEKELLRLSLPLTPTQPDRLFVVTSAASEAGRRGSASDSTVHNTLDPILVASRSDCWGNALRSGQLTSVLTGTGDALWLFF